MLPWTVDLKWRLVSSEYKTMNNVHTLGCHFFVSVYLYICKNLAFIDFVQKKYYL